MRPNVSNDYQTRADSLTGLDELAAELGEPLAPQMRKVGLAMGLFKTPDARIPYRSWARLLEQCAEAWDCPDLGLRLGARQNLNILGPVGQVVRLSDTVIDALRALEHSVPVRYSGFLARLDADENDHARPAVAHYMPKVDAGAGRQVVERSMALARNVLSMVMGLPGFKPLRVTFTHAAPADPQRARRHLGCPVLYGEASNALYFDAALLQLHTTLHDPAYAPIIQAYLDQARRQMVLDIADSTRQVIARLLATGRCSRESVAQAMGLHPRTLQRRLQEQGASFAGLLDSYRHSLALQLVARKSMPLSQVAVALGYADQSSFNQAFRRWTGTTPTAMRQPGPKATNGSDAAPP